MSKSEQPSSMASAPLQSSAGQERADLTSSSGAQCRNIHSAPVPAQAPAVGDRLELECSSIAFGGQVRSTLAYLLVNKAGTALCVYIALQWRPGCLTQMLVVSPFHSIGVHTTDLPHVVPSLTHEAIRNVCEARPAIFLHAHSV